MTNPNETAETDVVDQAFRRLRTQVARAAVAPPSRDIAARGRHRRARYAALAAATVLLVIAGGYALVGPTGERVAPVVPAESVSPSSSGPNPAGDRNDGTTRIPAGFLLHERDAREVLDNFDYSQACFGAPTMRRGAVRIVGGPTDEVRVFQNLYVYDSETTAKQVMTHLRDNLVSCSGFEGAEVLQAPNNPGWGDEAAAVRVAKPADGAGEHTGATVRFVAVRVGTAIATVDGYPEVPAIDDDARALVDRLCRYDPECRPKPGLPAPLSTLTDGGEAWAAVLGTYQATDPAAAPGDTIAAAAELGYHATIVPAGCDEGAAAALGLPETGLRYTAVYFDSQAAADTFADALPDRKVSVVKVRTRCL